MPSPWQVTLPWGVATLILGVLLLAAPASSIMAAAALLGMYLAASGFAEMALASALDSAAGSRIALFLTGALSLVLAVVTFRHFGYAYAVLLLALWIGVAFIFQGVSEVAVALDQPALPNRGWYAALGVISMVAGVVMLAWPFSTLTAATTAAGVWLVVMGTGDVFWALRARRPLGHVAPREVGQRSSARDITTR
ncbi:HdeD family acid-resistance protein [Mycobacterium sp. Marseille-P9652]|uniref:HdeD family acid-resistance protein n=1 Tax=Mycobacterium sp. Marseille-P9652 TaxID=2654950 RepID=UPI001E50377F|nr:HdeD family acid-resistance protein [Mycobacterium sp. Marseille-P9652]